MEGGDSNIFRVPTFVGEEAFDSSLYLGSGEDGLDGLLVLIFGEDGLLNNLCLFFGEVGVSVKVPGFI